MLDVGADVEAVLRRRPDMALAVVEPRQVLLLALSGRGHEQRPLAEFGQFHQRGIAGARHHQACAVEHLALGPPIEVAVDFGLADAPLAAGLRGFAQGDDDAPAKLRQRGQHLARQQRTLRLDAGNGKEAVDVGVAFVTDDARQRADVTQAVRAPVDHRVMAEFAGQAAVGRDVRNQDAREATRQFPLAVFDQTFELARAPRNDLAQRMQDAITRDGVRPHAEAAV